jgi:chaperonin GroEL
VASKQLFFRDAAREKLLEGATALADAVRVTLGPKSKCVLIGRKWGQPIACDDGVIVAVAVAFRSWHRSRRPPHIPPRSGSCVLA